ncbi:FmdB family zinc ribbon protein [Nitrospina watsonii]|uniref:Regulatory protein, FmdB family n=1 Tax=Nitrospina watsonii TaxID=1323948 RepID=A0ABN8VTK4_9BACT|nr:zinc ribbon domain-containing protein [Nitrospina watsonii]CAI2717237.1 Putative regulatory protein, FmdB family [Nitrospina watsonii]
MPLYEYFCETCEQDFTLLQSTSTNKEETVCDLCGSRNVKYRFSSFASKVVGGTPKTSKPVTENELPNKDVLKLPIPRLRSEL